MPELAMILAIDIGNTQTVLGLYCDGKLASHFRLGTDHRRTYDEYGLQIMQLLQLGAVQPAQLSGAVISSVVPPLTEVFARMCEERLGVSALVVGPKVKTGVRILYDNPKEVGADRIANAIAGYEKYGRERASGVLVVDFGTATTFDLISPQGDYLGGAIAPGVGISAEALFRYASKLPRVDLVAPQRLVGKSTIHSMQSGIVIGHAAMTEGMVARIRREVGFAVCTVATGGFSRSVAELTDCLEVVDEFLTLDGLYMLYQRNRDTPA